LPGLKLFLSYRREDSAGYAGRLYDHLSARFPKRVFMDVDSIAAGADFIRELEKSIKSSDILVALIGRQWLTAVDSSARRRIDDPNDFVRLELETAVANGVRIIPALVGGARIPAVGDLPDSLHALTRRQAIELGDASFARDVERLVQQVKEIGSLLAEERRERANAEKRRRKEDELLRRRQEKEKARLAAEARTSGRREMLIGAPGRWLRLAVARYPVLGKPILVAAIFGTLLVLFYLTYFTYFYVQYSRIVDARLRDGPKVTNVYALPEALRVGDHTSPPDVAIALRRSGYAENQSNSEGYFKMGPDSIQIYPGPESYFSSEAAVLKFSGGTLERIISLSDNTQHLEYSIEPLLVTNLTREKRRIIHFGEIPPVLVHAVISTEDKRFFQHAGFDPLRMFAYFGRDGAPRLSLTMALVRMLWPPEKPNVRHVSREAPLATQLEQKLTKEQIFELYANQVYLGGSGSFIRGFAEAAEYYFGKPLSHVNLPEAALLAGMVSRPNYYFPFRWPARAKERRDVVLGLMRENGFITDQMYALACDAPLVLAKRDNDSIGASYLADMVSDELHSRLQDMDFLHSSYRVYTTLDTALQHAAVDAVREALPDSDALITSNPRWRNYPPTEVALVALEPKTGEVRALVGGRKYDVTPGKPPKNHSIEKRPPGSAFLPFDYAAAMSAKPGSFSLLTKMDDSPRALVWNKRRIVLPEYSTRHVGPVTLGDAIARSLYAPALSAAEKAGYEAVAGLARKCGLYEDPMPAPELAMGYEPTTPLAVAAAYTVFANQGTWVQPAFVLLVRDEEGKPVYKHKLEKRAALDARTTSLIAQALQTGVNSRGAAGAVRSKGFTASATVTAGRSSDAWCIGFTSRLLAVVWIGYPDGREFPLDAAVSAIPIWTAFMTRASKLHQYAEAGGLRAPSFFERINSLFR
jgi:penicillin-binding protein 1B